MEELILKIQQGHTELYSELWEEMKGLIAWWAKRFFAVNSANGISLGLEWMTPQNKKRCIDDLVQAGFLGLVNAVEHYDPERGSFTTLLSRYLLRAFQEATTGRSIKQKNDPLLRCRSLDEQIGDEDSDATLLDFIPDDRNDIADAEERIFIEQLHDALEAALNAIPEREAAAIRSEFYDGCKQWETAEKLHTTPGRVHQLKNDGFRHIRNSSSRKKLERFLDENTSFYHGHSCGAFNSTKSSGVERAVIRREYLREKYKGLFDDISKQSDSDPDSIPA